jgi:uncharacterized membrane protein
LRNSSQSEKRDGAHPQTSGFCQHDYRLRQFIWLFMLACSVFMWLFMAASAAAIYVMVSFIRVCICSTCAVICSICDFMLFLSMPEPYVAFWACSGAP